MEASPMCLFSSVHRILDESLVRPSEELEKGRGAPPSHVTPLRKLLLTYVWRRRPSIVPHSCWAWREAVHLLRDFRELMDCLG